MGTGDHGLMPARSSSSRITAVMPTRLCPPGSRPRSARVAIRRQGRGRTCSAGVGADRVLTVDLHADQSGLFDIPGRHHLRLTVLVDDLVSQRHTTL